jgi:hypothetical protein
MCFTPCSVATAFSILRATSVSIWAGAAPGSDAVTVTVGSSRSGKFWIFMALKLMAPASVSSTNNMTAAIGLRMDQADTFMAQRFPSDSTTLTASPSVRNAAPRSTTRASAGKSATATRSA